MSSREKEVKEILEGVQRALVCLYEEPDKPDDPIEYVANFLGAAMPSSETFARNMKMKENLRLKIFEFEAEREKLLSAISLLNAHVVKIEEAEEEEPVEVKCSFSSGTFPKEPLIVPPRLKKPIVKGFA